MAYVNFVSQDDLPENNFDIGIDELDCPFTEEELGKTISTLIRNKSCGIDNIVADFFIDAKSFIVPYLLPIISKLLHNNEFYKWRNYLQYRFVCWKTTETL